MARALEGQARLKLVLAYIGTAYHGWQIQDPAKAASTVQGRLEEALGKLAGKPVRAFCSGRTDSGVHAEGQVVHCDIEEGRFGRVGDWRHALNAVLPFDIRVLLAERADPSFHARFDACEKTYLYQFWQERGFVPPRLFPYVWVCGPLETEPMREAAGMLVGEHDFASFANFGTDVTNTVRTIRSIELDETPASASLPPHPPMLKLLVSGTGFLKQMVRNIAGLLAYVGQGKVRAKDVPTFLEARNRQALPSPTAPAKGLTMLEVRYPS